jgi:hypothetical protein
MAECENVTADVSIGALPLQDRLSVVARSGSRRVPADVRKRDEISGDASTL